MISFIQSWPAQTVCLWFLYILISKCSNRFWKIMASDQILLSLNLGQGWENCDFWEMYMISLRFCFTFSRNLSEFDSFGWSNSTFGSWLSGTVPQTSRIFEGMIPDFLYFFIITKRSGHLGLQFSRSGPTPIAGHTFHQDLVQDFDFGRIHGFHQNLIPPRWWF